MSVRVRFPSGAQGAVFEDCPILQKPDKSKVLIIRLYFILFGFVPVQFYLFTRPDKQGDHPINVSISLFGERLCTSVGYAIAPDKWDEKAQRQEGCIQSYQLETESDSWPLRET